MNHSEIEELLGVYALDAVDAQEAQVVEEHLATCPRCRAEVAAHREVAAMLGNAGGEAPEGLWERIAGELEVEFAELPFVPDIGSPRAPRPSGASARARRSSRGRAGSPGARMTRRRGRAVALSLGAVAAALAVVVGVLSAKVGSLDNQVGSIASAVRSGGVAQQAALAAANPASRTVQLTSASGAAEAVLVRLPDGQAYWIGKGDMRALPADRTYQLWALASGRVVSIGLLGAAPRDVSIETTSNMTRFMVTAEPLGGTTRPTTPILVQGTVA